jgi:DNA transposition AAA+ family ATPase
MKTFQPQDFRPIAPLPAQAAEAAAARCDTPERRRLVFAVQELSQREGELQAFCAFALNRALDRIYLSDPKLPDSALPPPSAAAGAKYAFMEDEAEISAKVKDWAFPDIDIADLFSTCDKALKNDLLSDPDYLHHLIKESPPSEPTVGELRAALRLCAACLPKRLKRLVIEEGGRGRIYTDPLQAEWIQDLEKVLLSALQAWPEHARAAYAETIIGREVRLACEAAAKTKGLVIVNGKSRIGKTYAARQWARENPHRARFVTLDTETSDRAFFHSIAESLGYSLPISASTSDAKQAILSVLRRGDLTIIFDEAHALFPANTKTRPRRLEWIRTALVNREIPVVLIITPQWVDSLREFARESAFNLDQLRGRVLRFVDLPDDLPAEDFHRLARFYFPKAAADALEMAGHYAQTERYFAFNLKLLADEIALRFEDPETITLEMMAEAVESCLGASTKIHQYFPVEGERPAPRKATRRKVSLPPPAAPARSEQPLCNRIESPLHAPKRGQLTTSFAGFGG